MSSVDRVVDYMRGMPENWHHRETYATNFMSRLSTEQTKVINCVEEEKQLIPHGEKEIIERLQLQPKFTRRNMHMGVNINSLVTFGERKDVNRITTTDINFKGSKEWFLEPSKSRAMYAKRESTMHLIDDVQKRQIMSQCPNLSGPDSNSLHHTSIHERLSVPTDMRHLFMKVYLMLMDYNLACTSLCEDITIKTDINYDLRNNIDANARLATVTNHNIVVDAELFTPQELGLLCLAGQEYPSVWYAGDNMYNKIQMDEDDVVVVSDHAINIDRTQVFGSPERMYNLAWTLAAKLGCLPCWLSAIESMRGKPKQIADLMEHVESNRICCLIPTSFNISTSFGVPNKEYTLNNMSGYLSTSYSLIADLLYGMLFKLSISCSIESIGGCGTLLSSSTPRTSMNINGICREYGMQHTQTECNIVLKDWERIMRKPNTWDYGKHLKEYALGVAEQIMNGNDVAMPQLLLTVHSLQAFNTAFGMARGWQGPADTLNSNKNERMLANDGLAATSWLAGLRAVRPRVFYNRKGSKTTALAAPEQHLSSELNGRRIHDVGFWVADTLGGREDENEKIASAILNTEYPGTKCAMVYSYTEDKWVETSNKNYEEYTRKSYHGDVKSEQAVVERPVDKKPNPVTWGGGDRTKKMEKAKEHLRHLASGNSIKPSKEARHHKVSPSRGEAYVAQYIIDGEVSTAPRTYKDVIVEEGADLQYAKIDTAGDGQCGIHAIVKDLEIHGRISTQDVRKTEEIFQGEMSTKSFHDAQELAALCQEWGFGMRLIDKDNNRVTLYNDGTKEYTINIVKEGAHFSTAIPNEGKHTVKVKYSDMQETASEEFVARVREYGSLFGAQ